MGGGPNEEVLVNNETRTPERTNLSQFFNHASIESLILDETQDRVLTAEEINATYNGRSGATKDTITSATGARSDTAQSKLLKA